MLALLSRLRARVGRRGGVLLVFATMFTSFGFSVAYPDPARLDRLVYLYTLAPPLLWGVVWWLAAGIALISAFSRCDAAGYAALEGLAAVWAGAHAAAVAFDHNPTAAPFALLFTAIVVLLRVIDGWVDLPAGFFTGGGHPK